MFLPPALLSESSSPPPKPKRYYLPLSLSLDDLRERKKRVDAREASNDVLLPATPITPPGFYDGVRAVRMQSKRMAHRRKSSRQLTAMNLNHGRTDLKGRHHAFKKRNKKHLLLKMENSGSRDGASPTDEVVPFTSPPIAPSSDNHFLSPGSPKKHRLFAGFKKGNVSPSRSIVSAKELFTSSPMRFLKNASNTVTRTFSSPKGKRGASTHDIPNLDPSTKWYSPFHLMTAWKQKKQFGGSNSSLAFAAPATMNDEQKTKTNRSLSTPNACTPNDGKFRFVLSAECTSTEDFCRSTDDLTLYDEIEQSHQPKRMSIPDQRTLDEMNDASRGLPQRKYSESYRPLMDFPRKCSTVLEIEPAVLSTCTELQIGDDSAESEDEEARLPEARPTERKKSVFNSSRAFFEDRNSKSTSDVRAPHSAPQNPSFLAPNDEFVRAKSVAELRSFFSRFSE